MTNGGREATRRELGILTLPFERLETIHEGQTEVRLYVNELTGLREVGKRFDTLGVETAVATREGALLQRIQHPHLVPVFSVAEVLDDHLTTEAMRPVIEITMPYYERGSICDAFARGERFSIREARDMAVAALRGLSELHTRYGILHRDVKTPNIFLAEPTSLVRVGDLGAAAEMDQVGRTEGLGTPQLWTAPENFTEGRLTVQSDVFSAGIVLIELLAGPLPYEEYDRVVMLERLSEGRPAPWPRHLQLPPFISPDIRRVVSRATRVDPTRRFDSATTMARRLSEARVVDWHVDLDDPGEKVWSGLAVSAGAKEYRVEGRWRPRKEVWTISASRRHQSWRRLFDDVEIAGLDSNELVSVFDRVVRSAFR